MKNCSRVCAMSIVVLALTAAADSARADWPCYGYGYSTPYNWAFQRYGLLNNQLPPYFAMYPPVYYRATIEPRSYGSSPFAYPPDYRPAAAPAPRPLTIENPYVDPKPAPPKKSAAVSRKVEPLMVINPYVPAGGAERVAATPK